MVSEQWHAPSLSADEGVAGSLGAAEAAVRQDAETRSATA